MILLPESKLLYYPVPKAACTTLKRAVYKLAWGKDIQLDDEHVHELLPTSHNIILADGLLHSIGRATDTPSRIHLGRPFDPEEYESFAAVRNPISRLASAYRNKVKPWTYMKKYGLRGTHMRKLQKGDSFERFVELACDDVEHDAAAVDPHWQPQHLLVSETCKHLVSVARLAEALKRLPSPLCDLEIGRSNASSGGELLTLCERVSRRVREAYADDFRRFEEHWT